LLDGPHTLALLSFLCCSVPLGPCSVLLERRVDHSA
jgi:hypothetical protein